MWRKSVTRQLSQKNGEIISSRINLGFAAPLFPIVPILGFVFCFITYLSMVFDPEMLAGFIGCMIFIVLCYLSYYMIYHKKS